MLLHAAVLRLKIGLWLSGFARMDGALLRQWVRFVMLALNFDHLNVNDNISWNEAINAVVIVSIVYYKLRMDYLRLIATDLCYFPSDGGNSCSEN